MQDLIDSHSHLDAAEFADDRDAVYARARAAGVAVQIVPSVSRANFAAVAAACRRYPGCLPAWGLHPVYIAAHADAHLAELRGRIETWRPAAVGEIGLDLFMPEPDFAIQERYYVEQLKIAREFDLPVLLHCRRANDPILKHLRRVGVRGGIAHAFNGSDQQAEAFIKLGFKLGFGGAFTWERASNLRRLARELPLEAIVLETDSPDIPPAWVGKGRNEPAELARIAETLADLRGMSVEEVVRTTSANTVQVLRLPHSSQPGASSAKWAVPLPVQVLNP